MDTGSLFLVLGLFLLVTLYISRPFFVRLSRSVSKEEHQVSVYLADKERLINAIKELDFDQVLGKIPADEYPIQRNALMLKAAEVMRQIDALQQEKRGIDIENQVDQSLPSHRPAKQSKPKNMRKRTLPAGISPDDDLEALIAERRRERAEKAAGFCPQCGKPIQMSDRFCPRCGATLVVEE